MNEIIEKVLELGAEEAAIINTEDLKFNIMFRKSCEENRCGFYDKNYMCPPAIGSYDEVKAKVMAFEKGVFFKSVSPIESFFDEKSLEKAALRHNNIAQNIRKYLKESGYKDILPMATKCRYCKVCCKTLDKPCAFPELAIGCLSAYCIDVLNTADKLSMEYKLGDKKIAYFGMVLFK